MPTRTAIVQGRRRPVVGQRSIESILPGGFAAYRQIPAKGLNYNLVRNGACMPSSVVDYFERADRTGSLGTTPSGHTWNTTLGNIGIRNNTAYLTTNVGEDYQWIDCGTADGTTSLRITAYTTGQARIVARRAADTSYIFVVWSGGSIDIYTRGADTRIATTPYTMVVGDLMAVECLGSMITVYINGAKVLAAQSTFNQTTGTGFGFSEASTSVGISYKEFRFDPAGVSIGDQSYLTLGANASIIRDAKSPTGYAVAYSGGAYGTSVQAEAPVEAGSVYSFTIQALSADGIVLAQIAYRWLDDAGNAIGAGDVYGPSTPNTGYTELTLTSATAPGNARRARITAYTNSTGGMRVTAMRITQSTSSLAWSADMQHYPGGSDNTMLSLVQGLAIYEATTNLLTNGDIETALSGTVNGFNDSFADLNAWTLTGSPTVAANVVTIPAGAGLQGGHSEWWDWAAGSNLRFLWNTGATISWYLRYTDANNWVRIYQDGTALVLQKMVAGTPTVVNTGSAGALTNATWYWFDASISGTTFTGKVFTDSPAGTKSATQVGGTATGTIADAALATGQMRVESFAASTSIGGAFSNVCRVVIAAPPGWTATVGAGGVPAFCVSKTTKFSGTYSLSIYHKSATVDSYWLNAWTALTATYIASARVKTAGVGATQVWVEPTAGTAGTNFAAATQDWAPLASPARALTAGAQSARFSLNGTAGTVWFDLLGLEQKSYDSSNSDPSGLAFPVTSRQLSNSSVALPTGFNYNDFTIIGVTRFDDARLRAGGGQRTIFGMVVDVNNYLSLVVNDTTGRVIAQKQAGFASSVSVDDGANTAFTAGDTVVWAYKWDGGTLTLFTSRNGGTVGVYTVATVTQFTGTPSLYVGHTGNLGLPSAQVNGASSLIRLRAGGGSSTASLSALVLNPYQRPTGADLAVYTFDGRIARVY